MRLPDLVMPRLVWPLLIAMIVAMPLACMPWHSAHAQSADDAEAEQEAMAAQKKAEARKEARRAAPPSAIPGAESEEDDPTHSRMDLNPTAALFDAINRGSLSAAKEALNRGADTNAHNVLDQTPLDMAIDLGRNDIMFLLLSLRTYNPDGRLLDDVNHDAITTEGGNGHINIHGKTGTSVNAIASRKHLLSADGGSPQPSIGFLGFGGTTKPARNP